MTADEIIYAALSDAVADGVGVHYARRPQRHAVPCVVIDDVSETREIRQGGRGYWVAIDAVVICLAADPIRAAELAATIRQTLHGSNRTITHNGATAQVRGLTVQSVEPVPIFPPDAAEQSDIHGRRMTFAFYTPEL